MDADDGTDEPARYLALTPEAVKVLAHPLRSRLLGALRRDGPSSATELAATLTSNTGATSYHLRRLAAVGLVTDTGTGRGKERIWAASTEGHSWENTAFDDDEDARTAVGWLVRDYHRQFDDAYSRWLDAADSWPAAWRDVSGMSDVWVDVTPEQAHAMYEELAAVVERYRVAGRGDAGARRLHVYQFAFPLDLADVPDVPDDPSNGAADGDPDGDPDERSDR